MFTGGRFVSGEEYFLDTIEGLGTSLPMLDAGGGDFEALMQSNMPQLPPGELQCPADDDKACGNLRLGWRGSCRRPG
ncbi:hypothetical protein GPECTOR_297g801 [Gonium pectorale]|uniref:Uncharacterized protein n=1 Tax=Gonium pectorale TaxID=33097 RepID=A0A150FVU9_GONPE|nr:hypothetical protein GPECTOR_297g801 [Gonium pectorale]|eukprot:KXZ41744.1 hypothetical protein GPECTOR_297g801 [Gonium pectorale]